MKVLVVGGGGREHTLVWKISQSPLVDKLFCAPGNGGIAALAECVPLKAVDIEGVTEFALREGVGLVVVAPDDPLALGMVDALEAKGIRAFGPRKAAAAVESSKAYSKELMRKYDIPTAAYEVFDSAAKAMEHLKKCSFPVVVKADGLALGKGVVIAESLDSACEAVRFMMLDRVFGEAGKRIVIEEFLSGPEVSVLAFTDGKTIVPMVSSQDHKRALDNDEGLNTGGMGAFSPSRLYTPEVADYCAERIYLPTIRALNSEGRTFKGVLFFGLMLTDEGPKVLEYNARFGDPETQVVVPRLKNDIVEIFNAVIDERLEEIDLQWDDNAAVCVVAASGGYPQDYATGFEIRGMEAARDEGALVFHAGTRLECGNYYTAGGRVLGVTAISESLEEAIKKAYSGVGKISFEGMHYRRDIGRK